MSALVEIGKKFPVQAEGIEIPVDDEVTELESGEVAEVWFEADKDWTAQAAHDALLEIFKIKEEYPYFVLHYIRLEQRKLIVQFSYGPHGAPPNWPQIILVILAIAAIIIGVVWGVSLAIIKVWKTITAPPTGSAVVVAKDMKTLANLPNVAITVAGQTKKTGSTGQPVYFSDLSIGTHIVAGEELSGYHPPKTRKITIGKDAVEPVEIQYWQEDQEIPDWGYLKVDTTPVTGKVTINGQDYGPAPVGPIKLDWGTYIISYSEVKGWVRPLTGEITLKEGDEITLVVGRYTKLHEWDPWPWLRPVLIAGGVAIGAAVVVPQLITRRRRDER